MDCQKLAPGKPEPPGASDLDGMNIVYLDCFLYSIGPGKKQPDATRRTSPEARRHKKTQARGKNPAPANCHTHTRRTTKKQGETAQTHTKAARPCARDERQHAANLEPIAICRTMDDDLCN